VNGKAFGGHGQGDGGGGQQEDGILIVYVLIRGRTMVKFSSISGLLFLAQTALFGACGSSTLDAAGDSGSTGQLACSMPVADLDYSCSSDIDCVSVPGGDACAPNCNASCKTTVVNSSVAERYLADFNARAGTAWQAMVCNCVCLTAPYCCKGKCQNSCGGCGS